MYFGKPTKAKNAAFATLSFLLSGIMLYVWTTFEGIPPRLELQAASGTVSWVRSGKYGVKFGLDGIPHSFDYASKGNAMGLVRNTLSRPDHPVVTVLFNPNNPSGPIYSNDTYLPVFELSIAGTPFRSHEEVAAAWQADHGLTIWLAGFFALGGIVLSWMALRDRGAT